MARPDRRTILGWAACPPRLDDRGAKKDLAQPGPASRESGSAPASTSWTTSGSRGGQGSDQRRLVARSDSSRRVPRLVAGKRTPIRVRSFRENDGLESQLGRPGSGGPSKGKSKRTRSTSAAPSNNSSAKRPIARGVARGDVRSSPRMPSSHTSSRSHRRSNTHCERSTSGAGSGGVLVIGTSEGAAAAVPASSTRLASIVRRGSPASADTAQAAHANDALRPKRVRTRWKAPTRMSRRQGPTKDPPAAWGQVLRLPAPPRARRAPPRVRRAARYAAVR